MPFAYEVDRRLLAAYERAVPGAREELTRRANAAMAGHDRRMAAIDARYREHRLDVARRYGAQRV